MNVIQSNALAQLAKIQNGKRVALLKPEMICEFISLIERCQNSENVSVEKATIAAKPTNSNYDHEHNGYWKAGFYCGPFSYVIFENGHFEVSRREGNAEIPPIPPGIKLEVRVPQEEAGVFLVDLGNSVDLASLKILDCHDGMTRMSVDIRVSWLK